MDKHSTHKAHVAAKLGGAPIGGAPEFRPADFTPSTEAPDTNTSARDPPDRLISLKDMRPLIGNPSVSTVYRWMNDGWFPKPIKLGNGRRSRVVWRWAEVIQRMEQRSEQLKAA